MLRTNKLMNAYYKKVIFYTLWNQINHYIPILAFFNAGASLTPSPVIAATSPSPCRYSTIELLWAGSTREKRRAFLQASRCSASDNSSNSRPEYDSPCVDSFSPNTPIRRQIASAVFYGLTKVNTDIIIVLKHPDK